MTPENKYAEALEDWKTKIFPVISWQDSVRLVTTVGEHFHTIDAALTLAAKYGPAIELIEKGEAVIAVTEPTDMQIVACSSVTKACKCEVEWRVNKIKAYYREMLAAAPDLVNERKEG